MTVLNLRFFIVPNKFLMDDFQIIQYSWWNIWKVWYIYNFWYSKSFQIVILPANVKLRIFQTFKTLSIFLITSIKFRCKLISLLYEKWTPSTLMESDVRSLFLKPQSAVISPFLTPIPQISHFELFNFRPENCENRLKVLFISTI